MNVLIGQSHQLQSHTHQMVSILVDNAGDTQRYKGMDSYSASSSYKKTTSTNNGNSGTETRPYNYTIKVWKRTV